MNFQEFACLFLLCSILSINKEERWGGGKGGGAYEGIQIFFYTQNNKLTLFYANISIIVVREVRVVT